MARFLTATAFTRVRNSKDERFLERNMMSPTFERLSL